MTIDNQQPSEVEAKEEQEDQQPQMTESIEDETVSTNENNANETHEIGERIYYDDTNGNKAMTQKAILMRQRNPNRQLIMSKNIQTMKEIQ